LIESTVEFKAGSLPKNGYGAFSALLGEDIELYEMFTGTHNVNSDLDDYYYELDIIYRIAEQEVYDSFTQF